MVKKKFKDLRYVVMGKGCPRSVGFTMSSSATKYADAVKSNKCKPRIYKIENAKLVERFKKRFHNTKSYRNKIKKKKYN